MEDLGNRPVLEYGDKGCHIVDGEGVHQPAVVAVAYLDQAQFGVEGIGADKLGIHRQGIGLAPVSGTGRQGIVVGNQYGIQIHQVICFRLVKAWARVPPSTYSSSPPRGTP